MALYLLGVLLAALVTTSVVLHYGFAAFDLLPSGGTGRTMSDRAFFAVDRTLFLNLGFAVMSGAFWIWKRRPQQGSKAGHAAHGSNHMGMSHGSSSLGERLLFGFAMAAAAWLAGGMLVPLFAV